MSTRLAADVADLRSVVANLRQRVAQLEAAQPRDGADRALRALLPRSTQALPFTAAALLAHATVDGELHDALALATLQSPGELGAWLRDQAGTRDGVIIVRLRGRRWQVRYTSST